jgi:hypothetical protein
MLGHPCEITVVDARQFTAEDPIFKIPIPTGAPKVTSMIWSGLDDYLLTGRVSQDSYLAFVTAFHKFMIKSLFCQVVDK